MPQWWAISNAGRWWFRIELGRMRGGTNDLFSSMNRKKIISLKTISKSFYLTIGKADHFSNCKLLKSDEEL
jgi:hypothetical protein